MEAADGANLWMVLPNLLWFLFSLIALWIFKDNLKSLLTNLIWRVKTGASLKLTILNPDGKIWLMVAGGGASVIYTDTVVDLGGMSELANYGEYSIRRE